jgi:hypothetical protein
MTPEQRAADQAAKLEQRLLRREELNLELTRDFLRGKLGFGRISKGGFMHGKRAYPRLDKMLVAWTLILALPQAFNFRLTADGLVGNLSHALGDIYPEDAYINDTSLNNGLHVKCGGYIKATPSVALVTLVHEHIGNADGGIAKYFKSRDLEPPADFDIEVMEAVYPSFGLAEQQEDAKHKGHGSKAGVNPYIEAVAQRALQELKEMYGPKVLAALKHLL